MDLFIILCIKINIEISFSKSGYFKNYFIYSDIRYIIKYLVKLRLFYFNTFYTQSNKKN